MTTPGDFIAAGLLDGLKDEGWAERLALLERLSKSGVTLDELRTATAAGTLLFVGAERLVGGGNEYTLRELASKSGLDRVFLQEVMRSSGLAVPADDERVLGSGDLALTRLVASYRELVVADEDILEVTSVLARALTPVAETMRRIALKLALRPGASEEELAADFVEVVKRLTPMLEPLLGKAMNLQLRNIVRTEAINAAELSAGVLPGARKVGVCFADLVGFTRAGEQLNPEELGRIVVRLEHIAKRTVQQPVRLVKIIGDAVMLVSPDLFSLVDTALALVELAERDERLPQLRAGMAYGPAISRAADWFGRPVNLASRITKIARPGSVLAHDAVHDALPSRGFAWSSAGQRRLRGIREPVRLYRVRHGVEEATR